MNTLASQREEPSVAHTLLDAHLMTRRSIEAANKAVMDAIKIAVDMGDPNAHHYFGCDRDLLLKLADTSRHTLQGIMMTGIPIFSVRLATPEFVKVLENKEGENAALRVILKNMGKDVSLTSI